MARRMTRAESNQVRQKALVIKKYLYLFGRTMTDSVTMYWLWLPTIKHKLIEIDQLIRHSGLEVFAYDALLQIANGIRNQDKGQGTNELASYIHLNDWLIGVALGEHQRPGEDSENYGGDYRLHFGCVLSMAAFVDSGFAEGRNKGNYSRLSRAKKEQIDSLCVAGVVGSVFGVSADTVLKYWEKAINRKFKTYLRQHDLELALSKRRKMYHPKASTIRKRENHSMVLT